MNPFEWAFFTAIAALCVISLLVSFLALYVSESRREQ